MSLEGAVNLRLRAVSGITDLVSTRIYPVTMDFAPPDFPYITWEVIASTEISRSMGADGGPRNTEIRIHCWSEHTAATPGFNSVQAVADAVFVGMNRYGGTLDSTVVQNVFMRDPWDADEPTPEVFHRIVEGVVQWVR